MRMQRLKAQSMRTGAAASALQKSMGFETQAVLYTGGSISRNLFFSVYYINGKRVNNYCFVRLTDA